MQTEETVTLEQAGRRFGVGVHTLQRLIRIGALPEARKESRSWGTEWVIPRPALPVIAGRQGWIVDLTGDEPVLIEPDAGRLLNDTPLRRDDAGSNGVSRPLNGHRTARSVGSLGSAGSVVDAATESVGRAPSAPDSTEADEVDPDSVDEADVGSALVPHAQNAPDPSATGAPSMTDVLDTHLLDRLLGAQEERIHAVAEASHSRQALETMGGDLDRTRAELDVERREHLMATDRYRDERIARAVSEAKLAEMKDRVIREMALAEAEKDARAEAVARSIRAEREAAAAVSAMSWRARRRYRRRLAELD